MASVNNLKLVLHFAAAALLLSLASAADNELINKVCGKHTQADFCRTELGKASFSDISELATVSFDMVKARATNTESIKSLIQEEKDSKTKMVLKDCLSQYNTAADSINESRASFKAKDYWKMNSDASAASTNAVSCEDGFVEAKLTSPLTKQNNELKNSAQIVSIVANILAGKA